MCDQRPEGDIVENDKARTFFEPIFTTEAIQTSYPISPQIQHHCDEHRIHAFFVVVQSLPPGNTDTGRFSIQFSTCDSSF
jgi:hypothetical protein